MAEKPRIPDNKTGSGPATSKSQETIATNVGDLSNLDDFRGVVVWDSEQRLVCWSRVCSEYWYEPGEILRPGLPMIELMRHIAREGGFGDGDPDVLAQLELDRVQGAGPNSVDIFQMPDGRLVNVQRCAIEGGGHASTYTDVTGRQLAEESLKSRLENYQQSERIVKVGHWLWDEIENCLISCSEECANIHGLSTQEYTETANSLEGDLAWAHPDDRDRVEKTVTGPVSFDLEYRIIRRDGEIRFIREIGEPEFDKHGVAVRSRGTVQDITKQRAVEKALEDSEARYQEIFDRAPIALWVEDWSYVKRKIDELAHEGIENWHVLFEENRELVIELYDLIDILQTSNASLKLYGASTVEEYLGSIQGAMVLPEELDAFVVVLVGFIENQWEFDVESLDTKIGGPNILVRTRGVIPPSRRMDWSTVIYSMEDVKARRQVENKVRANERRFRTLFHQSPLGITVQDYTGAKRFIDRLHAQGIDDIYAHLRDNEKDLLSCVEGIQLIDANDTQVRMFGNESINEYREWENPSALAEDEAWLESYRLELTAFATGQDTYSAEVLDTTLDGTPIDIRMISRISDEALENWSEVISTHEDITGRKELDRMKSEFISTVSHELRTPLTSIKGSLGLVNGGATGEIPDAAKELMDVAYKNTNLLINLVNDVLDVEKIASGAIGYEFKPVNLTEIVSEAIKTNEGFLETYNNIRVTTDMTASAMVSGDDMRLSQVVANLLSNAIKFSPDGGEVRISVSIDGDLVTVSVRDHGEGIPAAFRDHIFRRFARADSSDTRRVGGTGLGLNISKSIIEAHSGTIDFESEENVGSTFSFNLARLE